MDDVQDTVESTSAVVLLSGGMDSTVLLHHVAATLGRAPIHALSFNYGQRHARELECAAYQAATAGVGCHTVLDISFFGDVVRAGTSLVDGGGAMPDLADVSPSDRDQPPTYVPNRNMMLLSIAAAYAEAQGIAEVFYGAQAQDEYGYWDCTDDFLGRINAVLQLNRKTPIRVLAPFMDRKKEALVTLGRDLGVDFAHTWSCYRGGERPCGTCPTCVERRKAFAGAGWADPLGD
jgi:7-cyano-7-deazaguanine synthase